MTDRRRRVVVALGGNAILQAGQRGTAGEQLASIKTTAAQICEIIAQGWEVVLTHGNGPQVGNILIQNEEAAALVPAMPLDACGAQSQGLLGYFLQQTLANVLRERGLERSVVALITQTLVAADDRAFADPTKPIGPHFTRERAERLARERGYVMREVGPHGWRRVVPSPEPRAIVEREVICRLVDSGALVIAVGGGGIPVRRRPDGCLEGVEAVVDKDLAAQRLALDVGAECLLILTDVEQVFLDYGKPGQRPVVVLSCEEARHHLSRGQFPPGSMGPKVEAATRFVENGGKVSVITALHLATAALAGDAGTRVVA